MLDLFEKNALDDCDDVDPIDQSRLRQDENEELLRAQPDNWLPFPLTLEKLLSEQKRNEFRHEVVVRQSITKDLKFFEGPSDDLLKREPSHFPG